MANSGGVAAEASYVRTLSIGLYFLSNLPMASPCLALPCPCPCLDHLDLPSYLWHMHARIRARVHRSSITSSVSRRTQACSAVYKEARFGETPLDVW